MSGHVLSALQASLVRQHLAGYATSLKHEYDLNFVENVFLPSLYWRTGVSESEQSAVREVVLTAFNSWCPTGAFPDDVDLVESAMGRMGLDDALDPVEQELVTSYLSSLPEDEYISKKKDEHDLRALPNGVSTWFYMLDTEPDDEVPIYYREAREPPYGDGSTAWPLVPADWASGSWSPGGNRRHYNWWEQVPVDAEVAPNTDSLWRMGPFKSRTPSPDGWRAPHQEPQEPRESPWGDTWGDIPGWSASGLSLSSPE
ncbi:hypothetical protein BDZ89DRAFT_1136022 [Hymenopellis radicata]|nr:hypothetical protein BDZ89DRAFT_1136022 [Hymenopellis radicata]